jgi:flagellar hook-basal body complex protein FliE
MEINNTTLINSIAQLPGTVGANNPTGGDSFHGIIKNSIDAVDREQNDADAEIARAVSGDSPDIHRTLAELQTADLHFQLSLQVRNKLVGAYEEIMRMQV